MDNATILEAADKAIAALDLMTDKELWAALEACEDGPLSYAFHCDYSVSIGRTAGEKCAHLDLKAITRG